MNNSILYDSKNYIHTQELIRAISVGNFWKYQEVQKTLTLPGRYVLCLASKYKSSKWLGCILFFAGYDCAEIYYIFVYQKFRRQGIAFKLLNELESFVKKKQQKKIFLEVKKSNKKAQNLYLKFSMRCIYERKKHYEDGESALIFEKNLDSK